MHAYRSAASRPRSVSVRWYFSAAARRSVWMVVARDRVGFMASPFEILGIRPEIRSSYCVVLHRKPSSKVEGKEESR